MQLNRVNGQSHAPLQSTRDHTASGKYADGNANSNKHTYVCHTYSRR